ncbi:MAG TPA: hypothetical protein PK096_00920 [Candidatus Saccharibacteria bacterium]|nr:hypothetical protein [Candidatus Saccharibacteria bacterium]HRK93915.1 hypothetical protein [Candidatus Saccharibacteria bacterium]
MSVLIYIHVILMSLSVILTIATTVVALFRARNLSWVLPLNAVVTSTGLGAGFYLLLSHPLDMRCVLLLGYLAAFVAVQIFAHRRQTVSA